MKNSIKKLLIAAGICVASTSAFAKNIFFVNIVNHTGKAVSVNYEEGRYAWDGSYGPQQGVHEMTAETNHVINPWQSDLGVTGDNYTWGHDDEMFFSITEQDPNNPRKAKKVKFKITNSHSTSFGIEGTGGGTLGFANSSRSTYKIEIYLDDSKTAGDFSVQTYDENGCDSITSNSCWKPFWAGNFEHKNFFTIGEDVDMPSPTPSPSPSPTPAPAPVAPAIKDFGEWNSGQVYPVQWWPVVYPVVHYQGQQYIACAGDAPAGQVPAGGWAWQVYTGNPSQCGAKSTLKATAPAVKIPAPKGTYDFGQWKAGEYPVVYSPQEIHPFVTYNGKGYVACNGDTTAKDVPGKSDAWKEVKGSLGNTCGYTVHSYKKQSTTPSVAKSAVSFW